MANKSVEELQAYYDIAKAKKMYEDNTDPTLRKQASDLANDARNRLGDPNFGKDLNADDFGKKYGVSTDWSYSVKDGNVSSASYKKNKKTTTILDKKQPNSMTQQPAQRQPLTTQRQPVTMQGQRTNSTSYIDELNNARRNQVMADLDKSRNQSLSNLDKEHSTIQPQYYDRRNETTALNAQGSRNFAEFMAARGGTNAGSNAQAEMNQNMAYQGEIGSLRRQEQAAYDDINRRRTDVNNAYNSDLASANAGIEAERLQQLIDESRYQDSYGLQIADRTGNLNGQRTLAGQSLDYSRDSDLWNRNYQTGRDQVSDRQWQDSFNYGKSRDQVGDNQWQQQFDFTKRQTDLDNAYRQQQLEQDAQQFAQSMGYNWANLNQSERQYFSSLAEQQRQFDANLGQRQSEFNRQFEYDQSQQQANDFNKQVNSYQAMVDDKKNRYAPPQDIINYIMGLENSGVSEEVIDQLLLQNGYSTGR